jgi:glycosyltransferase involved in cell wall biosynthesis
MPTKSFLVVENWPDVPEYIKPSSNVTFSKFLPNIRQLYSKIKILLVPSLWEEGAGRVVIEAMLNGIPVIAHKIGGISEFANGYVHFVTPPPIQKLPLIGTVLTPEILPRDVEKTSNSFVKKINMIDNSTYSLKKYSIAAKKWALKYCANAEAIFEDFIKELAE